MTFQRKKLDQLIAQAKLYSSNEGINRTGIETVGTYKRSSPLARTPEIETPALVLLLQGKKVCTVGEKSYIYDSATVMVGLYPVPVETEIVGASAENPFLAVGIELDISKLAELLLRFDQFDDSILRPSTIDPSAKFSLNLTDQLIDPFLRLFDTLANPRDAAILSDNIIDEIYYRLLSSERGGDLRALLQQKGKIRRISKAINYIHTHLDEPISVDQLAATVHMSRTAFYTNFKDVMQLSPLQYAKSVKLLEAHKLIQAGLRVSETSFMVGYNNLAQFSREFKRQFGYAPSMYRKGTQQSSKASP